MLPKKDTTMKMYDVMAGFKVLYIGKRQDPADAGCCGVAFKRASIEDQLGLSTEEIDRIRTALTALADKIRAEVLPVHGGEVIMGLDGSGFGTDEHPGKGVGCITVKTTQAGADAIAKLAGVTGVHQQPEFFTGAVLPPKP